MPINRSGRRTVVVLDAVFRRLSAMVPRCFHGVFLLYTLLALGLPFSFVDRAYSSFVEVPAVEVVHADEAQPAVEGENGSVIWEKEKILDQFINSVKEREKALDQREKELEARLANLRSVKSEIEEKIENLKAIRAEIDKRLKRQKAVNEANIAKLAKVYESTPPEQAGPLLSRIDVKIAAQLLLKMNNMKAGKIWGFVDPTRAVLISKELAKYDAALVESYKKIRGR